MTEQPECQKLIRIEDEENSEQLRVFQDTETDKKIIDHYHRSEGSWLHVGTRKVDAIKILENPSPEELEQ